MTTTFWKQWLDANELNKVRLVETLTLPSQAIDDKELYEHHCAVLMNSYLCDLEEYLTAKGG